MKTLLSEFSNDQLGLIYENTIGYNPFNEQEETKSTDEIRDDTLEILNEYSTVDTQNCEESQLIPLQFNGLVTSLKEYDDNSGIELQFPKSEGFQIFIIDTTESRFHVVYDGKNNNFFACSGANESRADTINKCLTKLFTTPY